MNDFRGDELSGKKKYILFGSSGCLGNALRASLEFNFGKESVIGLDSSFFQDTNWENKLCAYLESNRIAAIIYASQSRRYRDYPEGILDVINANYHFPTTISEISRKAEVKFVYCSTGSVYENSIKPISEIDSLVNEGKLNMYISSKIFAEKKILDISLRDMTLIVRPFYIFGPGSQIPALFPTMRNSVLRGDKISLAGSNGLNFNPISSQNAARAILFLLEYNHFGIYNLGGVETTNLREVVEIMSSALNKKTKFIFNSLEELSVISDQTKITELGFKYLNDLEEDIKDYAVNSN